MLEHIPKAHALQFWAPNSPSYTYGNGQGAKIPEFCRSYGFSTEGFICESSLRGVASWYVFRVLGSLAAGIWKYHVTMDDVTTPGPNPSAGSAAPAAC